MLIGGGVEIGAAQRHVEAEIRETTAVSVARYTLNNM